MSNTHQLPDVLHELQALSGDLLPSVILSTTWPTVPAPPSTTLAAFPTRGYVRAGLRLVYVDQPAVPVTVGSGAGQYYLAVHGDTTTSVSGWTRTAGSHYLFLGGADPGNPPGGLTFAVVTVTDGAITAVDVALANPRSRVAFSGANGALDFDPLFTFAPTTHALTLMGVMGIGRTPDPAYSLVTQFQAQIGTDLTVLNSVGIGRAPDPAYSLVTQFKGLVGADLTVSTSLGVGLTPDLSYSLVTAQRAKIGGTLQVAGPVGIGQAPGGGPLELTYLRATQNGLTLRPDQDTGGAACNFLNAAGVGVGSIITTGSATAFNTTSDARLKYKVQPLTDALALIRRLTPISHRWKADGSPGVGFRADEVQQVVGGVVSGEPDAVDEEGRIVPQMMDYSKLVPYLTAACQDLAVQVEALTTRLAALEERADRATPAGAA